MERETRILIVDDEPQITHVLRTGLTAHGFSIRTASDGFQALEIFTEWPPDLIVTDLVMPQMGGLELCRKLREVSSVPIIILSVRGEEQTKVETLDAGADDYVTKPFGIGELIARIRAIQRRVNQENPDGSVLSAGDFYVDIDSREVKVRGRKVRLTPKEFDLLIYFIRHSGKVLTHRTLLNAVWGGNFTEQAEYLRVFVGNLRKKIESDPALPHYIITEPWVGYRFAVSGDS